MRGGQQPGRQHSGKGEAGQTAGKGRRPNRPPEEGYRYLGRYHQIDKYDERLDSLVPESAQNMKRGKEKFTKKSQARGQNMATSAKRRQEERDKMQKLQLEIAKKAPLKVQIPDEIAVGELASRMKKTGAEVVRQLIKLGVMASLSDVIDYDTAALVAMELGCKVEKEVVVTIEERLIDDHEDNDEELIPVHLLSLSWDMLTTAKRPFSTE